MRMKASISARKRFCVLALFLLGLESPVTVRGNGFPDIVEDPLGLQPERLRKGATLPDGSSIACSGSAELSQPLELDRAIDVALCNNPEIRAAWSSIKVQAGELGEARAAYLPSMSLSVSRLANRSGEAFLPGASDAYRNGYQLYGVLTLRLLDFGRGANNKAASRLLAAALAAHDATLQRTMERVTQAYYDAMTAQAMLTARKKITETSEKILSVTRRRQERGAAALSDTLQAETALAKARLNEARSQGEFDKSLALLAQAMGLTPGTCLKLSQAEEPVQVDEVGKLNEWLSEAETRHPAIREARTKLDADKARITMVRAEGLPTLDAVATFSRNGYPNQGLTNGNQSVVAGGVTLNVPVFDGFGRTYKVRQAQGRAEQSEARVQETTNQVLTEVVKAHADVLTSLETLKASERLKAAAVQSLQSSLRRYERNAADIIELLNSQSSLADAEQERVRTIAEWRSARLRLLANVGVLGVTALLPGRH
jgi:outer membrane protein